MNETHDQTIRIMIVDDHFFVRIGLTHAIGDEEDLVVVCEADSGSMALTMFCQHHPDLVLMDMNLMDMTGDVALSQMREIDPHTRCILFSVSLCEEDIYRGVQAGALAYLPKSVERSELIDVIRIVANGGSFFPSKIRETLDRRASRRELTPREQETLQHLVHGRSNKEIAKAMQISSATVKLHITHLFEKLGVEDRTQAVAETLTRGLSRPN